MNGNDAPSEAANSEKPAYKRFRRPFNASRLDPAAAERQGKAASLAYDKFGDFAQTKEFLNAQNEALGGRPIDLAVASPEGLAVVAAFLAR
jgi:hypothetical protein